MSGIAESKGSISHNGEHPDTSAQNIQTPSNQSASNVPTTRFFYTKDKILSLYNPNSKPAPRYKGYEIIESKESIKPINLVTPEQLEELIREPPLKLNSSGGIGFPSPRLAGRGRGLGLGEDRPRGKSFDLGDLISRMRLGESHEITFADDPVAVDTSANDVKWRYKDPKGEIQGPFNTFDMDSWYTAGYFGPDLLVKMENQEEFVPLRQLIKPQQLFPFALLAVEVNEPILKPLADAPKPEMPAEPTAAAPTSGENPLGSSGGVPRTGLLEAPPKRRGSMPGVGVLNGSFGFPTYPPPPIFNNLDHRRASYTPPLPGPQFSGRRGSGTYYSYSQDTPVPPLPQPQFSPDIRVNLDSLRNSSSVPPPAAEPAPLRNSGAYPDPSTLHRTAQQQFVLQQMMQQQMIQQQMMQQQMAMQQMMQQQRFQQERAVLHQHNMEQQKAAQRKLDSPKDRS